MVVVRLARKKVRGKGQESALEQARVDIDSGQEEEGLCVRGNLSNK